MESFLEMYERLIHFDMDQFYQIEGEFYLKFLYDVPEEERPDCVVAFMNISSWLGVSLRDGVWTFYEGADPSELNMTLEFLKQEKEDELESMFAYGIHDYQNPRYAEDFEYPEEWMEEAQIYLKEHYLDFYEKSQGCRYGICLKNSDIPIGYVHLSDNESHDLGYGLRKDFWNQGIMTEAAAAVVGELKKGPLPFITATHDRNNPGSGGVMRNIGMTYQYSYEELWQPKNILVTFRMYQLNFDGKQDRVYRSYWNQYPVHFVEEDV